VNDIKSQERFYDSRWEGASYANRLKLIRTVEILDALCQISIEEPHILELGCGTGWLTAILGQFGPAEGLELSPDAVALASKKYSDVKFEQVNLAGWSPPASMHGYDVVVSHEVLEHLEDQAEHLTQVHQLLSDDGRLILTTPNASTLHAMPDEVRGGWSNQPIENWLTKSEIKHLFEHNDFVIEKLSTCVLGPGNQGLYRLVNSPRLNSLLRSLFLHNAYDWFRKNAGFGLHFVVVARKRNRASKVNAPQ
jgi:2-polyprenyl-3-methyl-5-hydroxy-6-metoxy-1,4-benzoquinol methylase